MLAKARVAILFSDAMQSGKYPCILVEAMDIHVSREQLQMDEGKVPPISLSPVMVIADRCVKFPIAEETIPDIFRLERYKSITFLLHESPG